MQQEEKTVITNHPPLVNTSATVNPDADSLIGQVLGGRYEIIRILGAGGMGTVYEARHIATKVTVAIKVMPLTVRTDEELLHRFRQEAKILAGLNHPNIVSVRLIDVDNNLNRCFMVMEYLEGMSLYELLKTSGSPDKKKLVEIFIAAAHGLGHAHARGIVHRDVKPGNLMLVRQADGTDIVKVLDFGISKMLGHEQQLNTQTGAVLGSPSYMSPEQFFGSKVDGRSDVYSLGCVMYQAITGNPPFIGSDAIEIAAQHVKDPLPEITDPNFKDWGTIISIATAKDVDDRYQSMEDLIKALRYGEKNKHGVQKAKVFNFGKQKAMQLLTAIVSVLLLAIAVIYCTQLRDSGTSEPPYAVVVDNLVETVKNRQEPDEAMLRQSRLALSKVEQDATLPKRNWRIIKELWRGHEALALMHQSHGNSTERDHEFERAIYLAHNIAKEPVCGVALDWAHCLMSDGQNARALKILQEELEFIRAHPPKKHKMKRGLEIARFLTSRSDLSKDIVGSKGEFIPNGNIIQDRADEDTIRAAIEKIKTNHNWSEIFLD